MIKLKLVTPERELFTVEADSVSLPTTSGEITILPKHVPLVSVLAPGMVTIRRGGEEEYATVSAGWLTMEAEDQLTILTDSAERADELDLQKLEEAKRKAEELLAQVRSTDVLAEVQANMALERELARIKVAKKHYSKRGLPHVES